LADDVSDLLVTIITIGGSYLSSYFASKRATHKAEAEERGER
jgi:hypothetical protein